MRVLEGLKFQMALCPECVRLVSDTAAKIRLSLRQVEAMLPHLLQRAAMGQLVRYDGREPADLEAKDVLRLLAGWLEDSECSSPTPTDLSSTRTLKPPATSAGERSSTPSGTETT